MLEELTNSLTIIYQYEKKSWSINHQKCRAHQENLIEKYSRYEKSYINIT